MAILVVATPLHLVLAIDAPQGLRSLAAVLGVSTRGLALIAVIVANRAALEALAAPVAGVVASALRRKRWVVAVGYIVIDWLVASGRSLLGQLTNYSRDWVIIKLPLRVTLDTDPERARKLVKKLGQELLADPLVGPKFLEPLKSQGVLSIDNFGIVIRAKFMTRPGDQFLTRRVVYARIHQLWERGGIEFLGRDVRVRVDAGAVAGDPRVARTAAAIEAVELAEGVDRQVGPECVGAGDDLGDER